MDAKYFGAFIAECRREKNMTQAELAVKLQVTDKAVSRWERGLGFPDIGTIEPLASALDLSVLEVMKSEKINETEISNETVTEALSNTLEVGKMQLHQERKNIVKLWGITSIAVIFVLFIVSIKWQQNTLVLEGLGMILPFICAITAGVLCIYGVWRKVNGKPCGQTFALAIFLFIIPIFLLGLAFLLGALGHSV